MARSRSEKNCSVDRRIDLVIRELNRYYNSRCSAGDSVVWEARLSCGRECGDNIWL